ncbi:hypothetical protein [Escherichia sp. MOD1-EC7003]|uniref:hypothetical protein n=1 Tax=Escherichia sp. MOD1-EC7003 TaxID=2093900 RepID=UPI001F543494|nr:hypothetical protein [Escherichia sp. MOD1-EC7003]
MMKKYFYSNDSEFISGIGEVYSEFFGDVAIRQVNILNGAYYPSSSVKDWRDAIGYLLYHGKMEDLDLSTSKEISKERFDKIWDIAVKEHNEPLCYVFGDASVPLQDSTIIIHIVDDLGMWGKGFVLSLSKHYPDIKNNYLR